MLGTEPVRVTIFNQNYSLVASEDPGRVEKLAQKVDTLMSEIASRSGHIDATRAAVLACLHLADQLDGVEHQFTELKDKLEHKTRQFTVLLDQAIAPAGVAISSARQQV
ncbi:MAG TPA: cell division protein ZapA [Bryobacteraceae bacterium]|nr:cell division protein ZapA [Bryobacteraceae bacterium]